MPPPGIEPGIRSRPRNPDNGAGPFPPTASHISEQCGPLTLSYRFRGRLKGKVTTPHKRPISRARRLHQCANAGLSRLSGTIDRRPFHASRECSPFRAYLPPRGPFRGLVACTIRNPRARAGCARPGLLPQEPLQPRQFGGLTPRSPAARFGNVRPITVWEWSLIPGPAVIGDATCTGSIAPSSFL